ncbi:MAG TPA: PPOX class F420-dependent oxidoreductase [Actinomycetota bacterium]|jgi:PPOX class probable F420-dependent enzyme|nr:PPOX class F420-dependent oxidoreductase [Actinomycetota bacterium]
MRLPQEARALIESDALAHVVTIDPDGRPQTTLAWVGLDGDEVVFATLPDQRKLRNLRRDPRVTISIQTDRTNDFGLREYLVIYGNARVVEGGGPELLQRLAYTYIGPDVTFPPMPDPPPGFVTRVTVERLGGIGPWAAPSG